MQQLLPCFYSEYGRYINKHRMIPSNIDVLKPVERRLLLSLFEVASGKKVKSAKVIGHILARYHPHGDISTYGALVRLVRNKFAEGRGNWGGEGLNDAKAAAYRYSECKLSQWVKNLAFRYIEHVPWKTLELDPEPLYLPSPIPLGLIGDDIITGISFYTTTIPQYKLSDLTKRLIWLLSDRNEKPPIIKPNARGCNVIDPTNSGQFEKILKEGIGSITFVPDGELRQNSFIIKGRAPGSTFNNLKSAVDNNHPKRKKGEKAVNATLIDLPGNGIRVEVAPDKRNTNIQQMAHIIWTKYLNHKINFNVTLVYDESGRVKTYSIDEVLLENFKRWKEAVLKEKLNRFAIACQKYIDNKIIQGIRQVVQENTSLTDIPSLIMLYTQKFPSLQIPIQIYAGGQFTNHNYIVTGKDVERIVGKKSIRSLIEHAIDLNSIVKEITEIKQTVINNDKQCYDELKLYS